MFGDITSIMTRFRQTALAGAALAATLTAAAPSADAVVIDNYQTFQSISVGFYGFPPPIGGNVATGSRASVVSTPPEVILGGDREMTLECFKETGSGLAPTAVPGETGDTCNNSQGAMFTADSGLLSLSNSTQVISRGRVLWDGTDSIDLTPGHVDHGMSADITDSGALDAFLMNVESADGDFFLVFDVWSTGGTEHAQVRWRSDDIRDILLDAPPSTAVPIAVPFDWFRVDGLYEGLFSNNVDFGADTNANLDFMDISAVQLTIWGRSISVDFGIGTFRTTNIVPAPATLGLLGIALAGFGALSRRRR